MADDIHLELNKHVGARVRGLRRRLGLTQKDLAEAVGVRFQQIQKYETGSNRISAARLWLVAKALDGASMNYFFEDFVR